MVHQVGFYYIDVSRCTVNKTFKKCYNPLSPLYSPDLSLPDYFLFPKLKMKLKGFHFADVAEIQEAVTDELKKPVYMPMELILN